MSKCLIIIRFLMVALTIMTLAAVQNANAFIHQYVVLQHKVNKNIVLLLGDQHTLGTKEQNNKQFEIFQNKLMKWVEANNIQTQILMEGINSYTFPNKKYCLDGKYNNDYRVLFIHSPAVNNTIGGKMLNISADGVTEKEIGELKYTTWIFNDIPKFYHKYDKAPNVEMIGCDSRYYDEIFTWYQQIKKQGVAELPFIKYLKYSINSYKTKGICLKKKDELADNVLAILNKIEKDCDNGAFAKYVKDFCKTNKNIGEDEKKLKEINKNVDKVYRSDMDTMTKQYDYNLLVELTKKNAPQLSIVPAGSSHIINVDLHLLNNDDFDQGMYNAFYFSQNPSDFELYSTELNNENENYFNQNFEDTIKLVKQLITIENNK